MKRIAPVALLAVIGAAIGLALAAPEPSDVPVEWELDIELFDVAMPISITLPGDDEPTVFWYLRYLVTNETGEDREFTPVIDLATNTGQLIRAGATVPPVVYRGIKARHHQPLLKDLPAMAGRLLQGADNAKAGVAIWPDFDAQAGQIDIFISGLSGEMQVVHLPNPVERVTPTAQGDDIVEQVTEVVLRKTLKLTYALPGEVEARLTTPAALVARKWVMR